MAPELTDFLKTALPQKFEPRPYYGHAEDSLTFYFNNSESYARRVDELLTLYLSLDTNELVGCQVKGVRRHLKRLGDFGVVIKHGKVRLDLFFHLLAFLAEKPERQKEYLDLSQHSGDAELELNEQPVGF